MYRKLNESDLNRLAKKVVNEQQGEGKFTGGGMGPGKFERKIKPYTITLDGSLFKNGVDKIDTSSSAFQKGVSSIGDAVFQTSMSGGKPTIQIVGGASAVGQKQGYDNNSLANRRANNFFNEVKKIFPQVKFIVGKPLVGVATVKNSPEAEAEQFVKLNIAGSEEELSMTPAIDHTTTKLNPIPFKRKTPVKTEKIYIVCFELTESEYNIFKNSKISNKIISAKKK